MDNDENGRIEVLIILKVNKGIYNELGDSLGEIDHSVLKIKIVFPIAVIELFSINFFELTIK